MTAHGDPQRPGGELEDLERRIAKAQAPARESGGPGPAKQGLGRALRLATEFVAAVVVGAGLGWLLDRWFGTGPVFLLVLFAFGVAAGFVNVFRAARELNEAGKTPRKGNDGGRH